MNGDISRSPSQSGALEETVRQMNILIQENRDLKGERNVWFHQSLRPVSITTPVNEL